MNQGGEKDIYYLTIKNYSQTKKETDNHVVNLPIFYFFNSAVLYSNLGPTL